MKKRLKKLVSPPYNTKKHLFALLVIALAFTVIYTFFLRTYKEDVSGNIAQKMTKEGLASVNLHALAADEFAIVTNESKKPTGKKITHAISLKDGQTVTLETDESTAVNVIEGSDKAVNYIKLNEDVKIHKKGEGKNEGKQKVEPVIGEKLKKNDVVPVLVQFNTPYGLFYESKQNAAKTNDKKQKFQAVKNKVAAKFSAKSKVKKDLHIINGIAADVDQQTIDELAKDPTVKKVEYDAEMTISLDTSLDQIQAKAVWGYVDPAGQPLSGNGMKIAILDTGVDYTHPDLGGCIGATCKVIGGYDFINNDTNPIDDQGHGTHVAATAAGNGLLRGVAPDAKIVAVKVLNSGGSGTWSQVIAGITYVVDPNGDGDISDQVNVASMSLGGAGNPDDSVSIAVDNATAAGVVFTIAAGNSGSSASTIQSPGTARNAITVAASCKSSQMGSGSCIGPIASFSSRGPLVWNGVDLQKPDVAAPGVLICAARWGNSFSTAPTCFDGQHVRISGTSMATPHVAGVAALIREANPGYTPAQVKQLLRTSARSLGVSANDQGAGEVDVKAALPINQKVNLAPGSWTVDTDPSKKESKSQQTFTVTPADTTISSLTPKYENPVAGVTITFSQPSVAVSGNTPASFDAVITVNNDTAKSGTYLTRINLVENNVIKGTIPVFLTIKPTYTVAPSGSVDYGIDNPGIASWTSDVKTFTLTNLRTDAAQSVSVKSSAFAAGINYQAPQSVTIPAGGTATVDTKFVVDNSKVANAVYSGTTTFSTAGSSLPIATKFVKFYVIVVQDPNPGDLAKSYPVVLNDRNGNLYKDHTSASPKTFYVNNPGTYDVIVRYYFPPSKYAELLVVKEGISVNQGITTVTVSAAEATNTVQVTPIDSSGAPGGFRTSRYTFNYVQLPLFDTTQGGSRQFYTNTFSSNYNEQLLYQGTQPSLDVHYYYYQYSGGDGSKVLTNAPGDFKVMNVKWDLDPGSITPLVMAYKNNVGNATFYTNTPIQLPFTQKIYSLSPAEYYFSASRYSSTGSGQYTDRSSTFYGDGSLRRMTLFGSTLPPMDENTVYQGLGPSVWIGRFVNNNTGISLTSSLWTLGYALGGDTPSVMRQDYGTKPIDQYPYKLYKNGVLTNSGVLPAFGVGPYNRWQTLPAQAGVYTFEADFPYTITGTSFTGKVRSTFNTGSTDPNPPAIKKLYFYTNNVRSEIYDPAGLNRVLVDFEPVGGTLASAGISFSRDGQTFEPLGVSANGTEYSATLPQTGSGRVTIKVTAKDAANNELNYIFELPQGVSTAPVPSIAPTDIPTPTAVPTVTPTIIPTSTPDITGPSITITNPLQGSQVKRNTTVGIAATATDPAGVQKLEFFINGGRRPACTDTTAPYTCSWKVPSKAGVAYQIQVRGYDTLNNINTASVTVTSGN